MIHLIGAILGFIIAFYIAMGIFSVFVAVMDAMAEGVGNAFGLVGKSLDAIKKYFDTPDHPSQQE